MLGADGPVYGLRFPPVFGSTRLPTRIEVLVDTYAATVRARWPEGPILLAGNCHGGSVALEVARRLGRPGPAEAASVALIDTAFPISTVERMRRHARVLLTGLPDLDITHEQWPRSRARIAARMIGWLGLKARRRAMSMTLRPGPPAVMPLSARSEAAHAALVRTFARYLPSIGDDRALLFCAGAPTNHRGWEGVVRGGLETVELPLPAPTLHPAPAWSSRPMSTSSPKL